MAPGRSVAFAKEYNTWLAGRIVGWQSSVEVARRYSQRPCLVIGNLNALQSAASLWPFMLNGPARGTDGHEVLP